MQKFIKNVVIIIGVFILARFLYHKTSLYYIDLPRMPFVTHLNKESIVLVKGETYRLHVYTLNKRVSYHTSDFKIAYVNLNGKVFAKHAGVAFITVKVGRKTLRCKVRVLSINRYKLTLSVGEKYQLHVKGNGLLSLEKWTSSKVSVATVNKFGNITAKRKGNAIISVKVKGKRLSCKLKVE